MLGATAFQVGLERFVVQVHCAFVQKGLAARRGLYFECNLFSHRFDDAGGNERAEGRGYVFSRLQVDRIS